MQDDTPIILDLSDLAKPLAKKTDYLATVREGSTGELANGYWLLEIYASLSSKNPVPVLLEPYSPGQNPVVLKAVLDPPRRTKLGSGCQFKHIKLPSKYQLRIALTNSSNVKASLFLVLRESAG